MSTEEITIIGGGWSVRNVPLERVRGYVIGVNESGVLAPRVDAIVSMDRLWTENRWEQLLRRSGPTWLRRSAVQNLKSRWPDLVIFDNDHTSSEFSEDPRTLHGTNSGACALNLAFQLRPRRLFLLGFDMNRDSKGRPYWHEPYSWANQNGGTTNGRYREWATQFRSAAAAFTRAGVEVFNVSPCSAIADFPKITPQQYLKGQP